MKKQHLFTLIELLVVIAIIAILAAMLLPSLSTVKGTAKKIECLAHFKTLTLGARMYSNDYNDEVPPIAGSYNIPVTWHNGYLGVPPPKLKSNGKLVEHINIYAYKNPKDPHHLAAKVLQCSTADPRCLTNTSWGWRASRRQNSVFTPGWASFGNFSNKEDRVPLPYKFSRVRPSVFLYIECHTTRGTIYPTGHTGGDVNVACFDGSAATWKTRALNSTWKEWGLKPNGNHDIFDTHDVF